MALRSPEIRYQILQKDPKLTGPQALELALTLERAKLDSEMSSLSSPLFVAGTQMISDGKSGEESPNAALAAMSSRNIKKKFFSKLVDQCKWCGRSHSRSLEDCPAKDAICLGCSEKGHFVRCCPNPNPKAKVKTEKLSYVARLFSVNLDPNLVFVEALVHGLEVRCLIDCGATRNFLSEEVWNKIKAKSPERILSPPDPNLRVDLADGTIVGTHGSCSLNLLIKETETLYTDCLLYTSDAADE